MKEAAPRPPLDPDDPFAAAAAGIDASKIKPRTPKRGDARIIEPEDNPFFDPDGKKTKDEAETSEPNAESTEEIEQAEEAEFPFTPGDFVTVRRSDGTIEDGWKIAFRRDGSLVQVYKEIDGKEMFKWSEMSELIELNPQDEESGENPEPTVRMRDRAINALRNTAERIRRKFTGEVLPEDEEGYKYDGADYARVTAAGMISIAMTYTGTKVVLDGMQYIMQGRATEKERQEIMKVLNDADKDFGKESFAQNLVKAKQEVLAAKIEASTFLTEAKKKELIEKINGIVETHDTTLDTARDARDTEVMEALEDAIQRRIKGTQVLKEGINTALILSGVAGLRTVGYTAVAAYERHQKVQQERGLEEGAEGKREGGYFQEMVGGAATETYDKLIKGGGKETRAARNMTRLQAGTVLLRGLALAGLAGGEISGAGGITKVLDQASEKWNASEGAMDFMGSNLGAHKDQVTSLFGFLDKGEASPEVTTVEAEAPDAVAMRMDAVPAEPVEGTTVQMDAAGELPQSVESATIMDEGAEEVEIPAIPSARLGEAMVSAKGGENSIIGLLRTQLENHPEEFGYEGEPEGVEDWAREQSLEAARTAGAVRETGDTRLSTEAIGRLAIMATAEEGGGIGIQLIDTESGTAITFADATEKGLTYEQGSMAGSATELSRVPEPVEGASGIDDMKIPGAEINFTHSPDGETVTGASIELLGWEESMSLREITAMLDSEEMAAMQTVLAEEKIGIMDESTERLVAYDRVLDKLEKQGLGDSAEAMAVRRQMSAELRYLPTTLETESMSEYYQKVEEIDIDTYNNPDADGFDRVGDIRVAGLGKIEFTYDSDGIPLLDTEKLLANARPVIGREAEKLLKEGWQDSVRSMEEGDVGNFRKLATEIYVYQKALEDLQDSGQGDSGEATILKEKLQIALTSEYAKALDPTNPIVKAAVEKGSVVLAGSSESAPTPEASEAAPAPEAGSSDALAEIPYEASVVPSTEAGDTPEASPPTEPPAETKGIEPEGKARYTKNGEIKAYSNDGMRVSFDINKKGETWNAYLSNFSEHKTRLPGTAEYKLSEQAMDNWRVDVDEINSGYLGDGRVTHPDGENNPSMRAVARGTTEYKADANVAAGHLRENMGRLEAFDQLRKQMEADGLTDTDAHETLVRKIEYETKDIQTKLAKLRIQAERRAS